MAWLDRAARQDAGPFSGLFDGLVGAAVVLAELGEPERALEILERARSRFTLNRSADLFGGAAGRGLGALHLYGVTRSPRALGVAEQAATELTELLAREEPARTRPDQLVAPSRGGLLAGWSGVALYLLRLHQATGDTAYLDLALDAARRDVDRLQVAGGGLHVGDDTGRVLLYLSSGSIGVGLVVRELLEELDALGPAASDPHREHARVLRAALAGIRHTTNTQFSVLPGLFEGRAGVLAGSVLLGHEPSQNQVGRHVEDLAWHLVGHGPGLAVPGFGLIRLSMDLATGSAGVLLAIHLAQCGTGDLLPALGLTPNPASARSALAMERR